MNFDVLPNEPTTKKLVRQEAKYAEAGVDGEVIARLPFATNPEFFFKIENFEAAGISVPGFARQSDQVLKENNGNNWNALVKRVKAGEDLPDQDDFDALQEAYDFSGVRAPSTEEGMSSEERVTRSELRKLIRAYISGGAFSALGISTVQTKKEQDAGECPDHKLELDTLEQIIEAGYEGEIVVVAETEDGPAELDFSEEPTYLDEEDEAGNPIPANFSAIAERARELAQAELAKARATAKGPRLSIGG